MWTFLAIICVCGIAAIAADCTKPAQVKSVDFQTGKADVIHIVWVPPDGLTGCYYKICFKPTYDSASPTCDNTTTPDTTSYDITNRDTCSDYTITVSTVGSTGTESPPSSGLALNVPQQVKSVSVQYVGGNQIHVEWVPPDGTTRCNYKVCWNPTLSSSTPSCYATTSTGTTTYDITGVDTCTDYSVSVNSVGTNNYSSQVVTETAYATPKNIDIQYQKKSNQFHVVWDPYDSTTDCNYNVCWNPTSSSTPTCHKTTTIGTAVYDITGIDTCTDYSVTVATVAASGVASQPVTQTAHATPDQVKNVDLQYNNGNTIHVEWVPPDGTSRCNYKVCWNPASDTPSCYATTTAGTTTYDIADVDTCAVYSVSVTTVGTSGDVSTSVTKTTHATPDQVKNVDLQYNNGNTIHVEWVPPDGTSRCHYKVCWNPAYDTPSCHAITTAGTTTYDIADVDTCAVYSVTVTTVGTSGNVSTSVSKTTHTTPLEVKSVNLQYRSGSQIRVEWVPPDGSTRCNYKVCWNPTSSSTPTCYITTSIGTTTYTVTGIDTCIDYSVTVTAVSTTGGVSPAVSETALTKPTQITFGFNSNRIRVMWTPVSGLTGCKYKVCWNPVSDSTTPVCDVTTAAGTTTYDITGIDVCSYYSVSVATVATSGEVSQSATETANTAPTPVKNLNFEYNKVKQIHVLWDPPDGATRCNYKICWSSPSSGVKETCYQTTIKGMTSYDITSLDICTDYTVTVSTIATSGSTSQSVSKTATTGLGLITKAAVQNRDTTTVIVQWEPPADGTHKCSLDHYRVCWNKLTDGTSERCEDVSSAVTKHNITNLEECVDYTIRISAQDKDDDWNYWYTITAYRGPGAIKNLSAEAIGPGAFHVAWDPPDASSSCTLSNFTYSVCWQDTTDKSNNDCAVYTREHSVGFEKLSTCTEYDITVTAELLYGALLTNTENITVFAAPGIVKNMKVNNDDLSTLHVSWEPPDGKVDCIDNYVVCWNASSDISDKYCTTKSISDTTHNITNLSSCMLYTVTVTAAVTGYGDSPHYMSQTTNTGPTSVENITIMSSDARELQVRWDPPPGPTECIDYYTLCRVHSLNKTDIECYNTSYENYTIKELYSCANYLVSVTTVGISGDESPAVTSTGHTGANHVNNLVLINVDEKSVFVNWSNPEYAENCRWDHYQVCWSKVSDGEAADKQCDKVTAKIHTESKISVLEECVDYFIQVRFQEGEAVSYGNTMATYRGPDYVADLEAETSSGVGELVIRWSPPEPTHSCKLTNFTYTTCWQEVTNNNISGCVHNTSDTRVTIKDVSPCTEYDITVIAQVIPGSLTRSRTFHKISAPRSPSIVSVDENSISMNWTTDPRCDGSYTACIHQVGRESSSRCAEVGSATVHEFDHLRRCTNYTQVLYLTLPDGRNTQNSSVETRTVCSRGNALTLVSHLQILIFSLFCMRLIQ